MSVHFTRHWDIGLSDWSSHNPESGKNEVFRACSQDENAKVKWVLRLKHRNSPLKVTGLESRGSEPPLSHEGVLPQPVRGKSKKHM